MVTEAVLSLTGQRVTRMKTYPTDDWDARVYDTILLNDDIEKPPKEEFEAKLQELIDAQPWKELREERNKRIAQTDYLATIDYPHASEEAKQAWLDYRQALRDLPAVTEDPTNPVWPQEPTN
jgi:hypothetical protein